MEIRCNQCTKKIYRENGIVLEDFFEGNKQWGYFSKKDRSRDKFYLCEDCYDKMIQNFAIPVKRKEVIEVM